MGRRPQHGVMKVARGALMITIGFGGYVDGTINIIWSPPKPYSNL